ncbi:MAG: peptide methionine sulfoxide reductase, partial [Streptococcus sp.]
MEGKWKILLVLLGLLVCFGLVYVIVGNGKQSSPEQIKKASMSKTETVSQQKQED